MFNIDLDLEDMRKVKILEDYDDVIILNNGEYDIEINVEWLMKDIRKLISFSRLCKEGKIDNNRLTDILYTIRKDIVFDYLFNHIKDSKYLTYYKINYRKEVRRKINAVLDKTAFVCEYTKEEYDKLELLFLLKELYIKF